MISSIAKKRFANEWIDIYCRDPFTRMHDLKRIDIFAIGARAHINDTRVGGKILGHCQVICLPIVPSPLYTPHACRTCIASREALAFMSTDLLQ